MPSKAQINNFLNIVAPLVQKYAKQYGYKVASPIIAQACCESAYGTSSLWSKYYNGFGMKCGSAWNGKSVNMPTKEEYTVGTLTDIKTNFRVYDNAEEGIEGYFKFISASRYANLKTATTCEEYLKMIKEDGYATSSSYVATNLSIAKTFNLFQYDNFNTVTTKKSNEEIAKEVLNGKWGNGEDRKKKLTEAGYDYDTIQSLVNKTARTGTLKKEVTYSNGDKIKLVSSATYANGKKIPSWVFKSTLYYRGTNNDGVIISTKKTGNITGVVKKSYITKV